METGQEREFQGSRAATVRARAFVLFDLLVFATLALVAWHLREAGLGAASLWLDDAWQALVARVQSASDMRYLEVTAPGFAWLLRGWFRIVGFRETTAQGLPFVIGVALAPLSYLVARRSGLSRPVSVFIGLVLAASPMHATFSSRVKPYAFDALAALGLVWGAFTAMNPNATRRTMIAVAVGAVASVVLSAPTAMIGGSALVAVAYAHSRRERGAVAAACATAFTGFAVTWWWVVLRPRTAGHLTSYWANQMIAGDNPQQWMASAAEAVVAAIAGAFVGPTTAWAAAFVVAVTMAAVRRSATLLLLAAPLAGAVTLAALGIAPLGGGRTDIYLLVPAVFLVGTELDAMLRRLPLRSIADAAVLATGIACAFFSPGSRPYPTEDVGPLVEMVEKERAEGEIVLVFSPTRYAYGLYGRSPIELSAAPDTVATVTFADPAIHVLRSHRNDPTLHSREITDATAGGGNVWFVASHINEEVFGVEDALGIAGFAKVEQRDRPGALASYWTRLAR